MLTVLVKTLEFHIVFNLLLMIFVYLIGNMGIFNKCYYSSVISEEFYVARCWINHQAPPWTGRLQSKVYKMLKLCCFFLSSPFLNFFFFFSLSCERHGAVLLEKVSRFLNCFVSSIAVSCCLFFFFLFLFSGVGMQVIWCFSFSGCFFHPVLLLLTFPIWSTCVFCDV